MDLESKWCTFTWSNNREEEALVKERLDRALCNMDWRVTFPNTKAIALPAIGSDHSPLLLNLDPFTRKRRKECKFESYWLEEEECGEIVRTAWGKQHNNEEEFPRKVKNVTQALWKWSKRKHPNAKALIEKLQSKLTTLTNRPADQLDREASNRIIEQIERLWRQEESYWMMRSRISWLKGGDRNTKFFHATTIQRRQRNKISTLLIDN